MIKYATDSYAFIDELSYFTKVYSADCIYKPKNVFYEINSQFLMDSQVIAKNHYNTTIKKRKRKVNEAPKFLIENCTIVSTAHKLFESQNLVMSSIGPCISKDNNNAARDTVRNSPVLSNKCANRDTSSLEVLEINACEQKHLFNEPILFSNSTETVVVTNSQNQQYILPQNSSFICADVRMIRHLIHRDLKYNLIVVDPPWPNKTVKRQKSYCLFNEIDDLKQLSISSLLQEDGLLCIWLTNNMSVHSKARQILEKDWGLRELVTWHWLKVTKYDKQPVVDFCPEHKVPFESIMFACHNGQEKQFSKLMEMRNFVIIGIPNANPSRKPPIQPILDELSILNSEKSLELYARYMLPNTISIGYEVLKFQDLYFFDEFEKNS